MLSLFHAVLCADVLTDSRSGQISYIRLIDTLNTPHVPVRLSRAYVGMLGQGLPDKKEALRLDLVGPDSTAINLKTFEAVFSGSAQKILIQLEDILFSQGGGHQILCSTRVKDKWQPLAALPVFVQLLTK